MRSPVQSWVPLLFQEDIHETSRMSSFVSPKLFLANAHSAAKTGTKERFSPNSRNTTHYGFPKDFCKILSFKYLERRKIQAIYFKIQGTYFKTSALYFKIYGLYFLPFQIAEKQQLTKVDFLPLFE